MSSFLQSEQIIAHTTFPKKIKIYFNRGTAHNARSMAEALETLEAGGADGGYKFGIEPPRRWPQ